MSVGKPAGAQANTRPRLHLVSSDGPEPDSDVVEVDASASDAGEDEEDDEEASATAASPRRTASWINAYLRYTENQESPAIFHIWTAIATIAGAVRRNVWINQGYYTVYPNHYIIFVAPSGESRKSTAMELSLRFLDHIPESNVVSGTSTTAGLMMKMQDDFMLKGKKYKPDGNIFLLASELTHTFHEGPERERVLKMLTDLYSGKATDEVTRSGGAQHLEKVNINFFAGTTPRSLTEVVTNSTLEVGWVGRITWVYSHAPRGKIAWPKLPEGADALEEALIHDICLLSKLYGEVVIEQEAIDFYTEWYNQAPTSESVDHPVLKEYLPRKGNKLLKLATIMVLDQWQGGKPIMQAHHIQRALELLTLTERDMMRCFRYVGSEMSSLAADILGLLAKRPKYMASKAQIISTFKHRMKRKEDIDGALDVLINEGLVRGVVNTLEGSKVYYVLTPQGQLVAVHKKRDGNIKGMEDVKQHSEEKEEKKDG